MKWEVSGAQCTPSPCRNVVMRQPGRPVAYIRSDNGRRKVASLINASYNKLLRVCPEHTGTLSVAAPTSRARQHKGSVTVSIALQLHSSTISMWLPLQRGGHLTNSQLQCDGVP